VTENPCITGYHAHIYYDAASKPEAARLREIIETRFDVVMGRWHDRPVGPHPMFSYQIAFRPEVFAEIVPFLALNRDGLTVFLHPETGDDVADHTAHAIWMGEQQPLDISALE
jgi:aromatic ring-cleaving dioxygenase